MGGAWEREYTGDLFSTLYKIEYCTGRLVKSENETRIVYGTAEKKALSCSVKVHTFYNLPAAAKITFHFYF